MVAQCIQHIIFISGAFFGGNLWDDLTPLLDNKEHVFYTPTLTGLDGNKFSAETGLFTHVDDVIRIVNDIYQKSTNPAEIQVILVGHSYGGMVITEVAKRLPEKIHAMVYVEAVVPQNESIFDMLGDAQLSLDIVNGYEVQPLPFSGFGLEKPEDIEWARSRLVAHPLKCFTQKASIEGLDPSIKKIYVLGALFGPFTVMQSEKLKKIGAEVYSIEASHSPMITEPRMLADQLNFIFEDLK